MADTEPTPTADILLNVKGLKKYFPIEKGFLRRVSSYVKAVDDVSFPPAWHPHVLRRSDRHEAVEKQK